MTHKTCTRPSGGFQRSGGLGVYASSPELTPARFWKVQGCTRLSNIKIIGKQHCKPRLDPDPGIHQLLSIFSEPTGTSQISPRLLNTPRMLSKYNFEARNEFSNSKKTLCRYQAHLCIMPRSRDTSESIFDPTLDLPEPQKQVMAHITHPGWCLKVILRPEMCSAPREKKTLFRHQDHIPIMPRSCDMPESILTRFRT